MKVPHLEVVATSGSSTWVTQTDEDSYYTNSAPTGAASTIALTTRGWAVTSMKHSSEATWANCAGITLQPLALSFTGYASGTSTLTPGTGPRSIPRANWTAYNSMHYIVDTLADHISEAEFPSQIWWTANSDDAGNSEYGFSASTIPCNTTTGVYTIGMSADARPENQDRVRYTAGHEVMHTIHSCTEQVGAGCNVNPQAAAVAGGPFFEGAASALGAFFNEYETAHFLFEGVRSREVYGGAGVAGDVLVDEADLEGTPSGAGGCTEIGPCASTEACYPRAHGKPRCMRRGATAAQCAAFFPAERPSSLFSLPLGVDSSSNSIPICVTDDYDNSQLWLNVGHHLFATANWQSALRAYVGSFRNRSPNRSLTQGADNFHDVFAQFGPTYEVTRAFHRVSTETFPWLDDASDHRVTAEAVQTPRTTPLNFLDGGATGQPLRITASVGDNDWFILPVNPNQTYEVFVDSLATTMDACIEVRDWSSGTSRGASNWLDGSSTDALRDATLQFGSSTSRFVGVRVFSALAGGGTYDIQFRNVSDDYADANNDAILAQPLRHGVWTAGTLNSTTDRDLFRYDRPTSATGNLTFSLSPSSGRTMKVYAATGTNLPGGTPLATSTTGTVTIVGATAQRYYLAIEASSTTGSYSVRAQNASCSGYCGAAGTYESPLLLPTADGGIVTESLEVGAGSSGNGSWEACRNGTACDWYAVALTAGQRLVVDTYAVTDSLCGLEVAIYAPPEQAYFGNVESGGAPTLRGPVTFDVGGSMSSHGANVAFVARRAGTYRIQVRATGVYDCPHYSLMAGKGPAAPAPGHL